MHTLEFHPLQEVFLTEHHLAIAMDFADGGNLSQHIDDLKSQGVRHLLLQNPAASTLSILSSGCER